MSKEEKLKQLLDGGALGAAVLALYCVLASFIGDRIRGTVARIVFIMVGLLALFMAYQRPLPCTNLTNLASPPSWRSRMQCDPSEIVTYKNGISFVNSKVAWIFLSIFSFVFAASYWEQTKSDRRTGTTSTTAIDLGEDLAYPLLGVVWLGVVLLGLATAIEKRFMPGNGPIIRNVALMVIFGALAIFTGIAAVRFGSAAEPSPMPSATPSVTPSVTPSATVAVVFWVAFGALVAFFIRIGIRVVYNKVT